MSIKDVLLVLETGAPQAAKDYALSFASQLGAHLSIAAVPAQLITPMSAGGDYPYELIAMIAEEAKTDAKQAYDKIAAEAPANVKTQMVSVDGISGLAQSEVGGLARHFDLAITAQAGPDSSSDDSLINVTLFDSGRPVIIVPFIQKQPAKFGHILVAWDGSAVAARALNDALPLLRKAGKVELVRITPEGTPPEELPGYNISRHLARHGINAELRMLPAASDVASALLSYAADSGADLLVMGGYGHSRMRQFFFGGTTRDILKSMTLPIFMAR
ncbi:universal stress protein [Methylocella sp. CPCC 101449]|jgi:nucleotide-binding universal stress UspA family protein|uniref:universal stress protein n=1 Tax=Methylocella sp. CPCC 101449 TaxID=2987531 RepID=UPI00288F4492|nr:universal stress protein [Methylocella sp. CPCC 101449]MDT2019632.1 universal stress protein [Methylocella sp. CPCC 101449]